MNALIDAPGDHSVYWNLRFAPLLRAVGVAPFAAGRAAIDHLDPGDPDALPEVPTETGFSIVPAAQIDVRVSLTPRGDRDVRSTVYVHSLVHSEIVECELWYAWAANGERWVQAQNIVSPYSMLHKADGRLRLPVNDAGDLSSCDLRIARAKMDGRVTLIAPSYRDLSERSTVSVPTELRRAGATSIGTRSSVLGDSSRNRDVPVVTFADENETVPVLAFTLTRLGPLMPTA